MRWYGLKDAEYGIPIGKLAKMASMRLANGLLKAKLCEISWMARKQFWFAVAPMMYAVKKNGQLKKLVSRRRYAQRIWRPTTPAQMYFVSGSGPQSLVI